MEDLQRRFVAAMFSIYQRAWTEAAYRATAFFHMLSTKGGLATAKYLINTPKPSQGHTNLYEAGRPDLTVEALVAGDPTWHGLFTDDDIEKAKRRLKTYGYELRFSVPSDGDTPIRPAESPRERP